MEVFRSLGSSARRKSIYALAGTVAVMFAAQQASATNFTWTNDTTNGLWDLTDLNWNVGASAWVNNDPAAANAAIFDSANTAAGTVTVSGTTTAAPIEVSGITFAQTGWTIAGGFLQASTSTTSGTLNISNTGVANTISSVIQDTSPTITTALSVTGVGTLVLKGASTYTGGTTVTGTGGTTVLNSDLAGAANLASTSQTLTLNGGTVQAGVTTTIAGTTLVGTAGAFLDTNALTINLNGNITDAVAGTGGGLTRNGTGTFNWNATSSFSGGFTLNAATAFINVAQGYTGNTVMNGNAQIRCGVVNALPVTTSLSINSSSVGGFQLRGLNQTLAGLDSGGVVNANRFVGETNGSGSGGVTAATLTITGTSTFGGKIQDGGNTLSPLGGTTPDNGNGIGGGATALHKTGVGTILTMSGLSNRFTGGTVIDSGTIALGTGGTIGGYGTYSAGQTVAPVMVNATGILDLGGQALRNSVHLNGGTLGNSGAGAATVVNGLYAVGFSSPSTNFQLSSQTVANFTGGGGTGATSSLNFALDANTVNLTGGGSGFTSAPTFVITGSTSSTNAAGTCTIVGGVVTALNFTYWGAGYSGAGPTGITITGGGGTGVTVSFNNDFTLVGMTRTNIGGGYTSAPTVSFLNSNDNSVPTATTTAVMSGVTLDADSFIGSSNGNIAINYGIAGVAGFTKIGTDTLTLNTGPSTYAGNTDISAGTILIGVANALPGTTVVTVEGGALAGGTLDLGGLNQAVTGLTGGSGTVAGVVTNSVAATVSTLTVTGTSQFNGVIQDGAGTVALAKTTGGVLTLTNNNTYSSGTDVAGGTLIVSNTSGSATGGGAVTMDGGVLGGHGTISGMVTAGSGAHTIAPSATLSATSTGTLTLGGLTTGSGTTLQFNLVTPGNALNSTVSNSDTISVTGANGLVLNGGSVNLTNHATGPASLGFYKVLAYNGTIGGTGLSSLTLPASVANVEYTFDTTHDSGFVDIHRGFAGDVDDSGFVDINDLAILAAHWQQVGGWAQGNFLNDPLVDINDLAVLAANWQTGITSFGDAADSLGGTSESFQQAVAGIVFGGGSAVPEPASLALLGMGAAGLLVRRRRR